VWYRSQRRLLRSERVLHQRDLLSNRSGVWHRHDGRLLCSHDGDLHRDRSKCHLLPDWPGV
jgi:hypothetical protein